MPFINRVCRKKKHLREGAIGSCLDVLNVRSLKNTVVSQLETEPGVQSKGLTADKDLDAIIGERAAKTPVYIKLPSASQN